MQGEFYSFKSVMSKQRITKKMELVKIFLKQLQNLSLYQNILKVTRINYVSRNQLHNTANGCQILNFGLSWPWLWEKCKGKTLLVVEISIALRRD